ncbi:MAG: ShlB/FhaC/HecB family hemolysin secretion/activation protein [Alphaproteobacteria bacterium]
MPFSLPNRQITFVVLLAVAASASSLNPAFAQNVPTSVNPANLEKRFRTPEQSLPATNLKTEQQEQAISDEMRKKLEKTRFKLKQVNVEGNSLYSDEQLAFVYEGKIGQEISLLDVNNMAKAITAHYRDNGYVLSQAVVPAQDIGKGTLRINVVEGYISNVRIEGQVDGDEARKRLELYAEGLKAKKPVNVADLERYLLLMDDLPGATAKGLVRPGRAAGSAEMVVTMIQKPYEASYTIDNRGSKFVGPFQHTATLVANSLLGLYDRTALRFITTSPTKELRFFDLQHEQQISDEGTRLVLSGSLTESKPGDSLKSLDINSHSNFFQAKLVHPFMRSRAENLNGRIIADTRNSETDVFGNVNLNKDRLRVVRAGGAYDFVDQIGGADLLDLQVSQGLDIFGATDAGTDRTRTDGSADFTKVNFDITRTQPLPHGFSLFTAATSQYSFDKLLAAEQFSVGGSSFGSAYDPSEISGDHGVAGRVELRYGKTLGDPLLQAFQLYGFYDIGRVWLEDTVDGSQSLASAGVGLRTNFNENLSGNLEVADPLTRPANNQGGHANTPRIFFSMTGRF